MTKEGKNGILAVSETHSTGREKAFVLTEKGEAHAGPLLEAMDRMEMRAVELLGRKKLEQLTGLMQEYDQALQSALAETR